MEVPETPEEINAFDAKTRLAELLRETERGRSYLIRRRGKPVARLVPVGKTSKPTMKDLVAAMDEIRKGIKGKIDIKALIEEGRRA